MKIYTIYAGVNGAGKSTFYNTEYRCDTQRINQTRLLMSLVLGGVPLMR